jgi:four helix bundle protein
MFTHHKLQVYQKALVLSAGAEAFCAGWGRQHAVVDHFRRASESIVLNLAEGARQTSGPDKARAIDYALGSALECAACLDMARIKGLLSLEQSHAKKRSFCEVSRMLIGLRKAWLQSGMSEEAPPYEAETASVKPEVLFHHESLDVYQVGLEFVRWFVTVPGAGELSDRLSREIDKAAASIVLNVAEGNGRYSELDHRRFLDMAAASAVKAAVYLDLYEQKATELSLPVHQGRDLLRRVVAMLRSFYG